MTPAPVGADGYVHNALSPLPAIQGAGSTVIILAEVKGFVKTPGLVVA